jgi:uncharacterized membrane protein
MNLLPAFGLGAMTGMRTMMALALFSNRAEEEKGKKDNPALNFLARPQTVEILKVLAAGEVIMDKMPFAPDRTDALPLIGRLVMGGLVGAAVSKDKWIQGGAVGALGALAATYAAYYIRKTLHDDRHIPNVVLGVAEDALVAQAANTIVEHYEVV